MRKFITGALLSIGLITTASAQQFPEKMVTIIVPYPPGGGVDLMIRVVASKLSEKWGKPVIVDNKGGAGTLIGAESVQRAKPDGYTLMATLDQTIVANRFLFKQLPYDPDKSFTPITMMAESPHILIAKSSLPVNNLMELVDLAKREKDKLNYGSYGEGSWPQLIYSMLNAKHGLDLLHIPYKGVAQMMTATVGGDIDLATGSANVAGEMIKAKRVKPLAIASNKRSTIFPDIPTTSEQGFPELQGSVWYGLFAPAGTPRQILEKIHTEVTTVLKQPEFVKTQGTARGMTIVGSTPADFSKRIAEDVRLTEEMVRAANIKPQ